MLSAPPNGRTSAPAQGDDFVPPVLRKGYLPGELRVAAAADPEFRVNLNRWPLGDIDNFSVCRYAYAQSRQRYYGESHSALRKYAPWETQYYECADALAMKAQGEAVSIVDGGALAPEAWSAQWSDLLRAFGVIDRLPVTRLFVPYRITHLPKVTVDVTVAYPGENTAPSNTQYSFGAISYTARKADIVIPVSNELMRDAPFLADQVLRRSSAGAIAYDRDYQALLGQGGPQPTGLVTMATAGTIFKYWVPGASTTSSLSTTGNHGTPSFLHMSQLRGKIHQLNGSANAPATGQAHCNGMIVHSRFEQTVQVQAGAGGAGPWTDNNGRPLWMTGLSGPAAAASEDQAGEGALLGQIWVPSNLLPTNSNDGGGSASSYIIAGWWEQFAVFESLQLAFDTTMEGSYFQADQTGVRVVHRWDCSPIHPEAFAVLAGVDQ